jgi:cyclophilin family peptidyl-prolyl cis-trans isomerase
MPMINHLRTLILLFTFLAGTAWAQDQLPDSRNDYLVKLETDFGNMILLLYDETPMHKENFVELARAGVYNGTTFHRVIENFMIQSGDPNTSNQRRDYNRNIIPTHVPAEINPKFSHRRGSLGAARTGGEQNPLKNSSPTQFYIVRHDRAAPHLDGEYTVFGQVMSGLEIIDSIAVRPTDDRDRPVEDVRINRAWVDVVSRSDVMKFYNYSYD